MVIFLWVIVLILYLIRHAKTSWNDRGLWQGNVDIPLNDEGYLQAKKLAQRFSGLSIEAIYTSPLSRSYQTAEEISKVLLQQPIVESSLRECEISLWNGLTMSETLEKYENQYKYWSMNPLATVEGVESLQNVQNRTVSAIQQISSSHRGNVIVVSHAIAIKMVICWVLGLPIPFSKNFRIENASVSALDFSDNPRLILLNDTCHLL